MPARAALALLVTIVCVVLLFSFRTPAVATTRRPEIVIPSASPSGAPTSEASGAPGGSPAPTATARWRDGTYTGQDNPNQFGDVQVAVTISAGRITDVQAQQLPTDRPRSQYISQQAGPLLHDEVLQAQSAQIDGVSGATYTSESYAQSVQSALDQAHS